MDIKPMKLSEFCKDIREKSGLSQNAFAKQHNISHTKVNKIEKGGFDVNPSPVVLARIADIYGFDINDYFKFGLEIDENYLARFNNLRLNDHVGTPSLSGNKLIDTFKKAYLDKELSADDNWEIVIDSERNTESVSDDRYYFKLFEKNYSFNGYVYFIKSISTINSNKDKETIDTLFAKIILNSLIETNDSKEEYKDILIVTGSEKIYRYILNKYKNKIKNTKFIHYRIFYCAYGKYKNTVIDEGLNESDFPSWIKSLPSK